MKMLLRRMKRWRRERGRRGSTKRGGHRAARFPFHVPRLVLGGDWYSRDLAEAALAHSLRDKTEAAYRRGDALEKRRKDDG